jgi:hypothetical protein
MAILSNVRPRRMAQALALVADLKLGLYCKIKPKAMFICQSYGTALGAVVNYSMRGLLTTVSINTEHSHLRSLRSFRHQCQTALS